jgi:hypothetical protein
METKTVNLAIIARIATLALQVKMPNGLQKNIFTVRNVVQR